MFIVYEPLGHIRISWRKIYRCGEHQCEPHQCRWLVVWLVVLVAATLKNFTSVSLLSWAHSPPPISELCLIVWPDPDPGPVITNYILNLQIAIDIYKVFALLSGFNAKYKKSGKKFSAQETDTVYFGLGHLSNASFIFTIPIYLSTN